MRPPASRTSFSRSWACVTRPASASTFVGPRGLGLLAVAALGLRTSDRDELETVGPPLEGTDHCGRHADHIPLPEVADFLAEQHSSRASDDHVGLLLLAMNMALSPHARAISEVANAQVARLDLLPGEAALDARDAGDYVLELQEVDHRVVGSHTATVVQDAGRGPPFES